MRILPQAVVLGVLLTPLPLSDLALLIIAMPLVGLTVDSFVAGERAPTPNVAST